MISKYKKLFYLLQVIPKLGFWNVAYTVWYRLTLKSGIRKLYFPLISSGPGTEFFKEAAQLFGSLSQSNELVETADRIIGGELRYYGYKWIKVGRPPQWFLNPFNGREIIDRERHWTKLPDFSDIDDIKNIWETSRFNWVPVQAMAHRITGDEKYITSLNSWLQDWNTKNPVNLGPNWKCGQEASIRLFNILIALQILGQIDDPSEGVLFFIANHLKRIKKNVYYSIAQNNNHGISEAAGLYLGGEFLYRFAPQNYRWARKYSLVGKKWLTDRVGKLFLDDGSFSQHSIVYHRMVLDLLSVVELFRNKFRLEKFPPSYYSKISSAIDWYSTFIDRESGNAPNLGANDGTLLFGFGLINYRDFCSSLVLSSSVFKRPLSVDQPSKHPLLEVFNVELAKNGGKSGSKSRLLKDGGYCKLDGSESTLFMRLPEYKFRPTNSDGLHIDLWKEGKNLIRDAGSYSYAISREEQKLFSGTAGHSTVQFDYCDQMPQISRFLYGKWLKPEFIEADINDNKISAGYTDYCGNTHSRTISEFHKGWSIEDNINGSAETAVLRYLLAPGDWRIDGFCVINSEMTVKLESNIIQNVNLKTGWESLHYMEKQPIPVLEIELAVPGIVKTFIEFKN